MENVKLFATVSIYDCDGKIYSAKNTKLSHVIQELNFVIQAKVDDKIKIVMEGVE